MTESSIRIAGLTVTYGGVKAVDDFSLSVPTGAIFGLLGPNGAGKSSTIRCISTVQTPQAGTITVAGVDTQQHPNEVRRSLGVVPQGLALYDNLSVLKNLQLFGGLYGLGGKLLNDRIGWGLALAQLEDHADKRVSALSGGMQRRLNIAASLLHDPKILVFDEPTAGVDPQSRNHILETIRTLHQEGRTVIYTTHYMEEVEALCDRVAIMDAGKLILADTLAQVLTQTKPRSFRFTADAPMDTEVVRNALREAGVSVVDIESESHTLEQVFLDLTGRGLRDAS